MLGTLVSLGFSSWIHWELRKLGSRDLIAVTCLPLKRMPSWLKMSFLIIEAALAKISVASEKSLFFKASWIMLRIPFLKTKKVFLPSSCSWASLKYSKKRSFSLVLFTDFALPRSCRRLSYKECSSDNLNRSFDLIFWHNLQARQTRGSYTRFHQYFAYPCLMFWRDCYICFSIQSSV